MSITSELRKWWVRTFPVMDKELHEEFTAIVDRIDTEHEHGMEERADQYSELRAKMNNCYIELPVDADGVPIRVGDVMEWTGGSNPLTVTAISLHEDGSWLIRINGCNVWPVHYRHHHAPTVEDVLREFAGRVCNSGHQWGLDAADTIAEYAAKLRLAGDDE